MTRTTIEERARQVLDGSGYLFQVRVEHEIRRTFRNRKGWQVLTSEYPWNDPDSGRSGFVDLILEGGSWYLLIECKRVRQDGVWAFPVVGERHTTARFKHLEIESYADQGIGSRWSGRGDFVPESIEAQFCAVRGSGEGHTPMLERLSRQLLAATEVFGETIRAASVSGIGRWLFFPAIVTNASGMCQ